MFWNCTPQYNDELPTIRFIGKNSGVVPATGELSPELVIDVLTRLTGATIESDEEYASQAKDALDYAPQRSMAFCAGCPHRASLWAIKQALALDGRNGVLFGDIGCYALGIFPTGFSQLKTVHAMGSGAGMACGFGNFHQFGVTSAKSCRMRRLHFFPCRDSSPGKCRTSGVPILAHRTG